MNARFLVIVVLSSCSGGPGSGDAGVPGPAPSGLQFTLECPERGVRAYDASRTLIEGVPLECQAHVADRSGAPLVGRAVAFLNEAGHLTAGQLTSATGAVSMRLETGLPLPLDVTPDVFTWVPLVDDTHTGEYLAPLWMQPYAWTESLDIFPGISNPTLREPRRPDPLRLKPDGARFQNNPRDNLVTLVAWTEGEEAFVDDNGNGTFDTGEVFVDLTEPFVDADDDGTRGPEEAFVDTNGNGKWDGKNGLWDGSTRIWVQQRVLWTGLPALEDTMPTVAGVTGNRPSVASSPSELTLRCPSGSPTCAQAGPPVDAILRLSDPWFNRFAHEGDDDGCTLSSSPVIVISGSRLDLGPSAVWSANQFFAVSVSDTRDPMAPSPPRSPVETFVVTFFCDFSPARGQPAERVVFKALRGTID